MRDRPIQEGQGVSLPPDMIELDLGARPLDEILSVAGRAREQRRRVRVKGLDSGSIEDLMRIAVMGGDNVVFIDRDAPARPERVTPRRWFMFGRR